jgi:hypothetical protein
MKILRWILIIAISVGLLFVFVAMPYMKEQTKKNSPQKTVNYKEQGMDLTVQYSSPYKKERVIFGELVPYDEVWRTGANEPTTFTTTSNIKIGSENLAAGTYSLWTIPGQERWKVIFNGEVPGWGVTLTSGGRETTRDPSRDMVQVEVPVMDLSQPEESFTIQFEEGDQLYLDLIWDETKVQVPISN